MFGVFALSAAVSDFELAQLRGKPDVLLSKPVQREKQSNGIRTSRTGI